MQKVFYFKLHYNFYIDISLNFVNKKNSDHQPFLKQQFFSCLTK